MVTIGRRRRSAATHPARLQLRRVRMAGDATPRFDGGHRADRPALAVAGIDLRDQALQRPGDDGHAVVIARGAGGGRRRARRSRRGCLELRLVLGVRARWAVDSSWLDPVGSAGCTIVCSTAGGIAVIISSWGSCARLDDQVSTASARRFDPALVRVVRRRSGPAIVGLVSVGDIYDRLDRGPVDILIWRADRHVVPSRLRDVIGRHLVVGDGGQLLTRRSWPARTECAPLRGLHPRSDQRPARSELGLPSRLGTAGHVRRTGGRWEPLDQRPTFPLHSEAVAACSIVSSRQVVVCRTRATFMRVDRRSRHRRRGGPRCEDADD